MEFRNERDYPGSWLGDLYPAFKRGDGSPEAVSRPLWNLGHLTSITFRINEDMSREAVAIDGKRVVEE